MNGLKCRVTGHETIESDNQQEQNSEIWLQNLLAGTVLKNQDPHPRIPIPELANFQFISAIFLTKVRYGTST